MFTSALRDIQLLIREQSLTAEGTSDRVFVSSKTPLKRRVCVCVRLRVGRRGKGVEGKGGGGSGEEGLGERIKGEEGDKDKVR